MSESFTIFLVAARVMGKVLFMASGGIYLFKRNIITSSQTKTLSNLNLQLLLPALLFTRIGSNVSTDDALAFGYLLIANFIYVAIGSLYGKLVERFFPDYLKGVFKVAIWNTNANSLPIVLIGAIIETVHIETNFTESVKYIGMYSMITNFVVWSVAPKMIESSKESSFIELNETEDNNNNNNNEKNNNNKKINKCFSFLISIKDILKRSINPPIVSIIFGVLFALCKQINGFSLSQDGMFYFIWSAIESLGDASVPCSMVNLGTSLGKGMEHNLLDKKAVLIICFGRLILVPFISLILIYLFKDDLSIGLQLVLFIESLTPTANNIILLCDSVKVNDNVSSVVGNLLFWEYCFSLLSITMWITIFLQIEQPENIV